MSRIHVRFCLCWSLIGTDLGPVSNRNQMPKLSLYISEAHSK